MTTSTTSDDHGLTPKQAAQLLGCSPSSVYDLLQAGILRGFKLQSRYRVLRSSIDALMASGIDPQRDERLRAARRQSPEFRRRRIQKRHDRLLNLSY